MAVAIQTSDRPTRVPSCAKLRPCSALAANSRSVSRSCSLRRNARVAAPDCGVPATSTSLFGLHTVRMRPRPGKLATVDDEVLLANRLLREPVLEDFPGPSRVAGLGRERGPGNVRRHPVVRHRPPRMVLGRRLRIPDVARVAGDMPAL